MKTIAVLIYDLTIEYHISVVDGILSTLNDKPDVRVLIAPVNAPHAVTYGYDYQYWTITSVLKNKEVDAVIVVPNSFTQYIGLEELTEELQGLLPKPVISIATPLKLETNSYTYTSPDLAYNQIIEHLKNKHNRKKIAFFSGELTGIPDSAERLKAYKKALKANGLQFDKSLVFDGDFSPSCTRDYIVQHYNSRQDIPYDALLCANDYMAAGAIGGFTEKGIKVPEDICVVGYDDSAIASDASITISTVNQHIYESAAKAGQLAYDAVCGKKIPKKLAIDSVPVYRQSCGCISSKEKGSSYYEQNGNYVEKNGSSRNILNLYGNALNYMSTIYHMLNRTDTVSDFNDFFNTLVRNLWTTHIHFFAACFYSKPKKITAGSSFTVPKNARLMLLCDLNHSIQDNYFEKGGIPFKTDSGLLPDGVGKDNSGSCFILPVSLQNMNYGYVICSVPNYNYTVYEVYLKIFINSMIHAYERTIDSVQNNQLKTAKQKTEKIARTDELTKVLNRRGFFSVAQKQISISILNNNNGCVLFCDMDGLKKINDTYGHKTGDAAIKVMANAISKSCRKTDIVGRLSGDEFAVLAPGFKEEQLPVLREKIRNQCVVLSKKENLPVVVSMSIGCVQFSKTDSDLQILLSEADKKLYAEKEIKHSKVN